MKNSTSTLLIILAVGIGFFYTYPSYQKLQAISQEKVTFDNALKDARELKELQNTLIAQYNSLSKTDLENIKKVVPEYFDGENLVSIINSIASSHGMQLFEVAIVKDTNGRSNPELEPQNPYQTKEVSFILKGDYKNFILSIQDLERSMLLMDLKKISIKKDQRSLNPNILDFEVKFNTYSIK